MFEKLKSVFAKKKEDDGGLTTTYKSLQNQVVDPFHYYNTYSGVFADVDIVLNRTGKPVSALRDLLYDTHFSSLWSVRKAPVAQSIMSVVGDFDEAMDDFFKTQIAMLNIPRLLSFLMESIAYGMTVLEFKYEMVNGRLYITDFTDVSPDLFVYTKDGWKLKTSAYSTEYKDIPENKIGIFVHNPTSRHPYGERLFTKAYWMVVFKRKGVEWWSIAVQKYGAPSLVGRVPNNTSDQRKVVFLDVLKNLISSGVSVLNDTESIEVLAPTISKANTAIRHDDYIDFFNNELSKCVLGQTLTTEVGRTGSRAVADIHNKVRMEIVRGDKAIIGRFVEQIMRMIGNLNFGDKVEDLRIMLDDEPRTDMERVQRDKLLFEMTGKIPNENYLKIFDINDEYYD